MRYQVVVLYESKSSMPRAMRNTTRAGRNQSQPKPPHDFYRDASFTIIGRGDNDEESFQTLSHFSVATECEKMVNKPIKSALSKRIVVCCAGIMKAYLLNIVVTLNFLN